MRNQQQHPERRATFATDGVHFHHASTIAPALSANRSAASSGFGSLPVLSSKPYHEYCHPCMYD